MPMLYDRRNALITIGAVLTLPAATICAAAGPENDDEVDDMARALRHRVRRGGADRLDAERQTLERLKAVRRRRGLNLQERDELFDATRKMPSVELEISFAFDSVQILPEGAAKLDQLGRALSRSEFKRSSIFISGHTDRKGTAEYNQALSERRAIAVADYLVSRFQLERDNLSTTGYGFEHLKDPANPLSGANRRVEIVNGD
jgi:outer membrane protein OmpA-like peptidoglycan-associated protein